MDQLPGDYRSSEGIWEKLSQIAVKGAVYDSRERQPHPKCLEGTRVVLLNHIYELSDNRDKGSRLIWLHGTVGVGKSAVAFTVAERMRGLKVTEQTNKEKRLAGSFFFSRRHTKRCTTGYLFATLAYQLARNFPSIREEVIRAIREDPALLDPDASLHDQMEALFLSPLRRLRLRLRDCPPLTFVVDALDECTSETEVADLISLLGQALRDPDLPVINILLTSRSEAHIGEAMQEESVCPLVCEIPVKISGEGVATIISLDGADVDNDIYIFLDHSFTKLHNRSSTFPQPTRNELARLASRAGRRFIVASTMMKFIDDGHNDPRDRLQLMLELTSELLPGTEVYKLYDSILSTCADPQRAYQHLSVVAALADPLPMSQISELLGPGQGKDVEVALVQLRSIVEIPTDSSLPVNIYHSSVRDYVSNPSRCSLPQVHSLLAHSSFRLIMQEIPESLVFLHALSDIKRQSQAIESHDNQSFKDLFASILQPPEPSQVLMGLLWLRGDLDSHLQSWLGTPAGRAWLQTSGGKRPLIITSGRSWLQTLEKDALKQNWLQTLGPQMWFQTVGVRKWLRTSSGHAWLQTQSGYAWLQTQNGQDWAQTLGAQAWLRTPNGRKWLQTPNGRERLEIQGGPEQLGDQSEWLRTRSGREWLLTKSGQEWLETQWGREWVETWRGREWLHDSSGRAWLVTQGGREWIQTQSGQEWLQTQSGQDWLQTWRGRVWFQTPGGGEWLQTQCAQEWLQTPRRQGWLRTNNGKDWLQTSCGREWLQTPGGREWLQMSSGQDWLQTLHWKDWLQTQSGQDWLQTPGAQNWLQTQKGQDWLQTVPGGKDWLQTPCGCEWLQTPRGVEWLQTQNGQGWLQTESGQGWLQGESGKEWLQTQSGQGWLETQSGRKWLHTYSGQGWLETWSGREWLQTWSGQGWLQTQSGRQWLQTQSGRDWLQMPDGQAWQSTPAAFVWMAVEEFSSTLEALSEYTIIPELPLLPAFQVIQQFKSLPDFLMFSVVLALRRIALPRDPRSADSPFSPDTEIFRAMHAFVKFADEARDRSRRTSDALKYACQNWAFHLSRAPNTWDAPLNHVFESFWNHTLLSWLERQWCLNGLRSCLVTLSEGQKLAKEHLLRSPESSQTSV